MIYLLIIYLCINGAIVCCIYQCLNDLANNRVLENDIRKISNKMDVIIFNLQEMRDVSEDAKT